LADEVSKGFAQQLEAQDLSPLEAELFPESPEHLEAEEQAEVEGY